MSPVTGTPRWWSGNRLPRLLLALLFLVLLGYVFTQAGVHGRSYDEPLQDNYGQRTLSWYTSGGQDKRFLEYRDDLQMPQHGPFFETVVAVAQKVAKKTVDADPWQVRSVVTALAGVLGVLAIALCGLELGGWWLALVAALGLTLYPRYLGAIFNNSKDMPLAVAMLFTLWLVLRLVRRWPQGRRYLLDTALVGVSIGAAAAIRINALVWGGLLVMMAATWWVRYGRAAVRGGTWRASLFKQLRGGLVLGVATYATMVALWPYLILNPVFGLLDSFRSMSKYPWLNSILFDGQMVPAMNLPSWYAPVWLLIGSPLPTVLFALAGIGLISIDLIRGRASDLRPLLVVGAALVPLLMIIGMHATMYNGPRHFLFVIPPLILIAAYALVRLGRAVAARLGGGARTPVLALVVLALVASQVQVVAASARLYPYEYMYFSPVVGEYRGAQGRFETDYWAVCSREAAVWLADNWRQYAPTPTATFRNGFVPVQLTDNYLPPELKWAPAGRAPDFTFWMMRDFRADTWPDYRVIHDVVVEGYVLCQVKVRPDWAA